MAEIPSIAEATTLLDEASRLNPGPWVAHSLNVASAAKTIAEHVPGIDAETAYIFGCLHDIGRRAGVTGMRHVIDGYSFLHQRGYEAAARICLTHSYPVKTVQAGSGIWDGTAEEFDAVQAYLDSIEYSHYDRLIQLCDSIAIPEGFCLMEKRLVDVVMRYGFNDHTLMKWRAFFQIKTDFDRQIGESIYDLLPGIIGITFAS